MASWTSPKTYSSGAALTASEMNTYQRDNETWIKDTLTTHGMTSDTTVGQVKSAIYGCRVYRDSTQSIANATGVAITFPSETVDADGFHSTVTNTSRLTIPSGGDGDYIIQWHAEFASNATGYRRGLIWLNGASATVLDGAEDTQSAFTGANNHIGGSDLWIGATAGDYVEVAVVQSSGGSLNINTAHFSLLRVGV